MSPDYKYIFNCCKVRTVNVAVVVAAFELLSTLIYVSEGFDGVEIWLLLLALIPTGCLIAGILTAKSWLLLPHLAIYIPVDIYYFGGTLDGILGAFWPEKFAHCEKKPLGPNDEYGSCVQEYKDFALYYGVAYACDFLIIYVIYRCYRYLKSRQEQVLPTFHDSNHKIAVKYFANPNHEIQTL